MNHYEVRSILAETYSRGNIETEQVNIRQSRYGKPRIDTRGNCEGPRTAGELQQVLRNCGLTAIEQRKSV